MVVAVNKSAYSARNAARDAHAKTKCFSSPKAPALQNVQCLQAASPDNPNAATSSNGQLMTTKPELQKALHVLPETGS